MTRDYVTNWEPSSIGGIWLRDRYVGMWHGGASYAAPYADDAEWIGTLADAIDAVRDRRDRGHWCRMRFRYVFRPTDDTLTPCAHDDNSGSLTLYRVSEDMSADDIRRMIESDGCPDRIVEFGPRGGIVVNRT